jgi:cysteine-rich repeat protein
MLKRLRIFVLAGIAVSIVSILILSNQRPNIAATILCTSTSDTSCCSGSEFDECTVGETSGVCDYNGTCDTNAILCVHPEDPKIGPTSSICQKPSKCLITIEDYGSIYYSSLEECEDEMWMPDDQYCAQNGSGSDEWALYIKDVKFVLCVFDCVDENNDNICDGENTPECTIDTDCGDADFCTEDTCVSGVCNNIPKDGDGDGTPDCNDGCPDNKDKTASGACGCIDGEIDNGEQCDGGTNCTADCACPEGLSVDINGDCGCGDDASYCAAPEDQDNGICCASPTTECVIGYIGAEGDPDRTSTPQCKHPCDSEGDPVCPDSVVTVREGCFEPFCDPDGFCRANLACEAGEHCYEIGNDVWACLPCDDAVLDSLEDECEKAATAEEKVCADQWGQSQDSNAVDKYEACLQQAKDNFQACIEDAASEANCDAGGQTYTPRPFPTIAPPQFPTPGAVGGETDGSGSDGGDNGDDGDITVATNSTASQGSTSSAQQTGSQGSSVMTVGSSAGNSSVASTASSISSSTAVSSKLSSGGSSESSIVNSQLSSSSSVSLSSDLSLAFSSFTFSFSESSSSEGLNSSASSLLVISSAFSIAEIPDISSSSAASENSEQGQDSSVASQEQQSSTVSTVIAAASSVYSQEQVSSVTSSEAVVLVLNSSNPSGDDDDDGDGDNDDGIFGNQDDDDDGNGDNDDGIFNNDISEDIVIITTQASKSSLYSQNLVAAASICGNGILETQEECDDSNRRDNDGCSSTCLLEIGICGDGIVQTLLGEQCELSLHSASLPYSCNNCRFLSLFCGDGKVDAGEECDDGERNSTSPDAHCRPDCGLSRCGDGIIDSTEICDDGNYQPGDGCDRYCRVEESDDTGVSVIASDTTIDFASSTLPASVIPNFQQQFQFPRQPSYQQLPYQLPYAQLQPLIAPQGVAGDTGPAAVAVVASGMAAGFGFMRKRRK